MGGSCFPPLPQFQALETDLSFELVEKSFVVLAHGVDEARNQQIAGGLGAGQETSHEIPGALLIPFLAGPTLGVQECPFGFAPLEEAFLEEAVEGRHHGGVGEGARELITDVTDVAFTASPEDVHDLNLEGAEVV